MSARPPVSAPERVVAVLHAHEPGAVRRLRQSVLLSTHGGAVILDNGCLLAELVVDLGFALNVTGLGPQILRTRPQAPHRVVPAAPRIAAGAQRCCSPEHMPPTTHMRRQWLPGWGVVRHVLDLGTGGQQRGGEFGGLVVEDEAVHVLAPGGRTLLPSRGAHLVIDVHRFLRDTYDYNGVPKEQDPVVFPPAARAGWRGGLGDSRSCSRRRRRMEHTAGPGPSFEANPRRKL